MTVLAFVVTAALASIARVALSAPLNRSGYPAGTLLVNVIGSLAVGLLAGSSPAVATAVGVGAFGAFTTFSTFSVEVETLGRQSVPLATSYVIASLVGSVGAAWIGLAIAS